MSHIWWRMQGPNGLESVKVTGAMGSNQSDVVRNWALAGLGIIPLASWDVAECGKQALLRALILMADFFDVAASRGRGIDQGRGQFSPRTKPISCSTFSPSRDRSTR